jgi:hypothetical protein
MPIFTAIAAAIGLTGFFASAFVFGAEMLASVGISYLQKALAGSTSSDAATQGNMGMQGTLQASGDVPRSFPLGDCATAGSLVYANYWGASGDTPNAYFTQVIAVSDLPGCSLTGLWVNGQKCSIYGTDTQWGRPVAEFDKDGKSHLWIRFYDGTQTTADSFLVGNVSSIDRPYQNTRVGKGVAYAIVTTLTEDTLFTGFPSFLFELAGVKLYDPTKDSTNGGTGTHRYSDPTTWGGDGDKLPAVQIYNLLRGFKYNGIWLYGLQTMAAARLPAVNWNTQINKCRATIQGVSGLEPTYRSGGQISVDQQAVNAAEALLSACQGRLSEVGGFYKIHLGTPDSVSFSFTDLDILSTENQIYTPFLRLSDSINGLTATYPDPTQSWQSTTAPPLYRTDFEAIDGNRRLLANPSLDFVPYAAQVQRLMKSALLEARRERSHVITMPPVFWIAEPGDVCSWSSDRNGYVSKQFRIDATVDKSNLDISLSITEVDPNDYSWNHASEFQQPTSGGTNFPRPAPQGVIAWFASAAIINDANGSPRRPAISLSWDGTISGVVGIQYEVRLTIDQSSVTRGRTDQLAAGSLLISQSLLPNTAYQVRGQYLPSAPRDMLWSDWIDVTTLDIRFTAADFADALASSISNIESFDSAAIQSAIDKIASIVSNAIATSWLDKKDVRTQLNALAGTANASIAQLQQVAADQTQAFANFQTTVSATFGPAFSSVSTVSTAVATLNGYAASSYSLTLDTNGYVIGYHLVNGGAGANSITFTTDKFQIAAPGVNGGAPVNIFTIANVNGVPKTVLRGDVFGDGTLTINAISTSSLSVLRITGTAGKMIQDFGAGTIEIFE